MGGVEELRIKPFQLSTKLKLKLSLAIAFLPTMTVMTMMAVVNEYL